MKKLITIVIVIVLVIFGYFFFGRDSGEEVSVEPIKIGFIGALSGVGTAVGEEELKGATLAVEQINERGGILGRPIELVAEDVSLDKLRVAVSATRKLIDVDKVLAIVGPQWDEPALAILPVIEEEMVSTISPDVTSDLESQQNFEYFFSTWYDNKVGIEELLRFADKQNWRNIAVIRSAGGGFWQYTRNLFIEAAHRYNINVVEDVNIGNPLATDFRTFLTKIKQSNPDAIFMVLTDLNECPFIKQKRELGISVPVLSTESAGNQPSIEGCSNILEDLYFSTPRHMSRYDNFVEDFRKRFGGDPLFPTAVNAHDAVNVITKALKQSNLEGGSVLREKIANIKYQGIALDVISFDEKGFIKTPDDAFEIRTVRNNQFIRYKEINE